MNRAIASGSDATDGHDTVYGKGGADFQIELMGAITLAAGDFIL